MPPKRKASESDVNQDSPSSTGATANYAGASTSTPKRQRVSRACDQCRAAREKCDGVQPHCFPCTSQNRACTYAINPKKRGVQTGYIRTLELALAWVFDKFQGSERSLTNLLTREGAQGRALLVGKDTPDGNRLHQRWSKSKFHRELDNVLSGKDPETDDKGSPADDQSETDEVVGGKQQLIATQPNPFPQLSPISPRSGSVVDTGPPHRASIAAPPSRNTPSVAVHSTSSTDSLIRLPPNHWRLLDVYFSYTHCWFPILEKQDLLKTSYMYPDKGLQLQTDDAKTAVHTELWAALALASFHESANLDQSSAEGQRDAPDAEAIYRTARKLFPSENGPFQITHVRSLLLLCLVNVGRQRITAASVLMSSAVEIALHLGMGTFTFKSLNDPQFKHRSVLMGVFILDTVISLLAKRPPHLRTDELPDDMAVVEDDLDEWQPWAPCEDFGRCALDPSHQLRNPSHSLSTFNQLNRLLRMVNRYHLRKQFGTYQPGAEHTLLQELQHTINPHWPFSRFVVAGALDCFMPPSTHVLRAIMLWSSMALDASSDILPLLLVDTVEQYVSRFGACGTPPLFAMFLVSLDQHPAVQRLQAHDRERWDCLRAKLAKIWSPRAPPARDTSAAVPVAPRPILQIVPPLNNNVTRLPSQRETLNDLSPASYYSPTAQNLPPLPPAPQQQPHQAHQPNIPHHPHAFTQLNSSFFLGSYATSALLGPTNTRSVSTPVELMSHHQQQPQPQQPQPQQQQPQQQQHPATLRLHRQSTSCTSTDYEHLLDDLAAIDTTDQIDADPQFMTNLGFAPGCDVMEIWSREFGTV